MSPAQLFPARGFTPKAIGAAHHDIQGVRYLRMAVGAIVGAAAYFVGGIGLVAAFVVCCLLGVLYHVRLGMAAGEERP